VWQRFCRLALSSSACWSPPAPFLSPPIAIALSGGARSDAFLASGNDLAGTPAKAGYPSIVVPGGFFDNVVTPPFPDGFNAKPGPAGVMFSGRAFSEPRLIALAYAFEQLTRHRVPPSSTPPLPTDRVVR
jgi:amidase